MRPIRKWIEIFSYVPIRFTDDFPSSSVIVMYIPNNIEIVAKARVDERHSK